MAKHPAAVALQTIKVTIEQDGSDWWWRAYVFGRSAPLLRPVPGNAYPAQSARWPTADAAVAELPGLLGHAIEVVRVIGLPTGPRIP
jgi:hypothetical protein